MKSFTIGTRAMATPATGRRCRTPMAVLGLAVLIPSVTALGACGQSPADVGAELGDAEVRVLFLGNSLTYAGVRSAGTKDQGVPLALLRRRVGS